MAELVTIARIRTDFSEKFGIPRQSGLVPALRGKIVFEGPYRNPDALRGIEEYSHLWLLWDFSQAHQKEFCATVAPPRLGGRERKGVFATRSPFRPNSIGLSSVELIGVEDTETEGRVLIVAGADLLDGTPIYDIKPYLAYTDAHPQARGSFGEAHKEDRIRVDCPDELLLKLPEELRESALAVLAQDPRAAYNKKPDYVYGMAYGGYDIRFTVEEGLLTVREILPRTGKLSNIK